MTEPAPPDERAELDRVFDAMVAAVRHQVLPKLDDSFARGQAFGLIYMLQALQLQLDWAVPPLHEQLSRQRKAAQALALRCQGTDAPPPPASLQHSDATASGATLRLRRNEADAWMSQLLLWADSARAIVGEALCQAIEHEVRACARDLATIEARLTPRPMYAQMTTGQDVAARPSPGATEAPC